MNHFILSLFAIVWLADGLSLLVAPRWIVDHIRDVTVHSPQIYRWEVLSVGGGLVLLVFGTDLAYGPLWILTGCGMIGKGLFLWLGPTALRARIVSWCLAREDVDYRFWGVGLCSLAVLLLHALGWIGS